MLKCLPVPSILIGFSIMNLGKVLNKLARFILLFNMLHAMQAYIFS